MKVEICHYSQGAARARGMAVVIDVFRAFSAACYAFDRGAARIIATRSLDTARDLKKKHPEYLLMGERHAQKPFDFDFGNSPSEIALSESDLNGKTLIHTTHAGTKALLAARNADPVITGSFVNACAVAAYILKISPDQVCLVCAGFEGQREAAEDQLCARYIQRLLYGEEPEFGNIPEQLKTAPSALRFFDPADSASPEIDFHMCLSLDRFGFIIRRTYADSEISILESQSCVLHCK